MKRRTLLTHMLLLVCSLAMLVACGASGSNSVGDGFGRLEVLLTDAPLDLSAVSGVMVSITGVVVYPGVEGLEGSEAPPIVLSSHPGTFDLLTLTGGATDLLASGEVPAGFYNRIRLEVSSATLVYADGTTAALKIEPNKVDVPIRFQVIAGDEATIVLDFDAAASVKVNETANGQLILRPVVTPKPL